MTEFNKVAAKANKAGLPFGAFMRALALDGDQNDVKWVMVVGVDNKDQYFVGSFDGTTFTPDQMQTVFELYATHAIEARICNDIGTKAVTMPTDAQAAHRVEQQLRDFIRGGVSDALTRARAETPNLTPERIQVFVDAVYESAFAILQTLGDAEANQ